MPDTPGRLLYLRIAIVVSTIASLAFTHKLWISARFFPLTPVFPFLKPIPSPFDYFLFGAMALALAACAFTPRLIPIFAVLAVVVTLFDQSRMQPWFYIPVFLLLGIAFESPNACRLILASTYFWGGIFLVQWPPNGEWVPFTEFLIGIMLLSGKFRPLAILAAVVVHGYLLFTHPAGVFWPWNISLPIYLVILFWQAKESPRQIIGADTPFHIAMVFLFTLAPLLSFAGMWDQTSNRNRATIFLSHTLLPHLPGGVAAQTHKETPELDSISISDWSLSELHSPPYPQIRIYKSIARQLCKYAQDPVDVRLSITTKSATTNTITGTSYSCAALK